MYLGWDIGIKNLAYCNIELLKTIPDNSSHISLDGYNFNIKDWDVINLVEEIDNNKLSDGKLILASRPKLSCFLPKLSKGTIQKDKDGQEVLCQKKAVYCLDKKYNGCYRGICDTHYKKLEFKSLPSVSDKSTCYYEELNNNSREFKKDTQSCKNKSTVVFKDHLFIGLCKKHKTKYLVDKSLTSDIFLDATKAKKATHINLTTIGTALYNKLDEKQHLLDVSIVLLENQPVLTNPTMKSVQMLLYSYFIIRGIKERPNSPITEIKCYQASKKNELIKYLPEETQQTINERLDKLKNKYSKNKKSSIMITNHIIGDNSRWGEFYKNHTKQDDLADSLLMTMHYLIKKENDKVSDNKDNKDDKDNKDNEDNENCVRPLLDVENN